MHICPECGATFESGGFCTSDGAALVARGDDLLIGQVVGPYRIAGLLGVGGMGRVYKAVHPNIGSRVAIKILARDCTDSAELVERFFAEARAVNLIRHENIVNVLDLATLSDGRPYIVMEFLDGAPLSTVIASRGQLPLGGLARLMGEVLGALHAAHDKAIVHRDLKPDNIFVSPQGRAKVLDFGIAKLMPELSGRSGPTRTGSLLGTPHYMAPEQALSRPVDARTDVYAAGVILFEGATGRKPFHAESLFDLLSKHIHEPPPAPRSLRPDMPALYEAAILRAMAKDPDQRFQSVTDLAQALSAGAGQLPQEAWVTVAPGPPASTAVAGPPSMHAPSSQSVPPGGPAMGGRVDRSANAPGGHPVATAHPTPASLQGGYPNVGHHPQVTAPVPGSTVSSGQVQPRVGQGSGRRVGLWLGGLALLGLAATGVALGVTDGDSDGGPGDEQTEMVADNGAGQAGQPDGGTSEDADGGDAAADDAAGNEDLAAALTNLDRATGEALAAAGNVKVGDDGAVVIGAGGNTGTVVIGSGGSPRWVAPGTYKPQGFDPKQFDVTAFLDEAEAKARAYYDDAVLVRVDASGVYPTGKADLTLSESFYVNYTFISPSRAERPADLPLGVEHKPNCKYYVWVTQDGVWPRPLDGWTCDEPAIGRPKCSFAETWRKSIAAGAPAENAVATIGYYSWNGATRWYVTVGDAYSGVHDDTCR